MYPLNGSLDSYHRCEPLGLSCNPFSAWPVVGKLECTHYYSAIFAVPWKTEHPSFFVLMEYKTRRNQASLLKKREVHEYKKLHWNILGLELEGRFKKFSQQLFLCLTTVPP
ncbi:hypothetical protein HPP92_010543 [Vanilla planifolia]|uniref:Uncharacterized protein n=1 Tax=Vanilla planifolia TaxID=51239 RepID=A0A835R0Q3_VANPL|nr:hypothetical protein HPP92_010782 [Vanilla planifolia]KAG0482459.1 hypothetical protein HPP92_010543 [Vanilla planifolia]